MVVAADVVPTIGLQNTAMYYDSNIPTFHVYFRGSEAHKCMQANWKQCVVLEGKVTVKTLKFPMLQKMAGLATCKVG